MSRPALLDASVLIALERETSNRELGPARRFLPSLRGRRFVVSVVTVEEVLEGAADEAAALASLHRFSIQGLHARCRAHRMGKKFPTFVPFVSFVVTPSWSPSPSCPSCASW